MPKSEYRACRKEAQNTQEGWEFGPLSRFVRPFAANPFTSRGLEPKHQGRNVPSALACLAVASAEPALRRAFPTAHRVSRISPTSAALARKTAAISAAITIGFNLRPDDCNRRLGSLSRWPLEYCYLHSVKSRALFAEREVLEHIAASEKWAAGLPSPA